MFEYSTMKEALNERIPEIFELNGMEEIKDFWQDREIPNYCYFELLDELLVKLLTDEPENTELLNRVFTFMEDMATSEDIEVQNLLQVQTLESLWSNGYSALIKAEKMMFPTTMALSDKVNQYLRRPQPSDEYSGNVNIESKNTLRDRVMKIFRKGN